MRQLDKRGVIIKKSVLIMEDLVESLQLLKIPHLLILKFEFASFKNKREVISKECQYTENRGTSEENNGVEVKI